MASDRASAAAAANGDQTTIVNSLKIMPAPPFTSVAGTGSALDTRQLTIPLVIIMKTSSRESGSSANDWTVTPAPIRRPSRRAMS